MFIAPLGDQVGRRRLVVIGSVIMSVTTFASGLTTSYVEFVLWRLGTGLSFGICMGNVYAITADYVPKRIRLRCLTMIACAMSIGALVAGFVGEPIRIWWGSWRGLFFVGGAIAFVITLAVYVALPESVGILARSAKDRIRLERILRQLGMDPERSAMLSRNARARERPPEGVKALLPLKIMLEGTYRRATVPFWAFWTLTSFTYYLLVGWLPAFLQEGGWAVAHAQRAGSLVWAGGAVGGLVLASALDVVQNKLRVLIGVILCAAVSATLFVILPERFATWVIPIVLLGLTAGGVQYIAGAIVPLCYPAEMRATAFSCSSAVSRSGAVLGPLVGGQMLGAGLLPPTILAALAVPILLSAIAVSILFSRIRPAPTPDAVAGTSGEIPERAPGTR
jgi:AAHS family 4-hydroxybenzoate transporter-like MFS transporter